VAIRWSWLQEYGTVSYLLVFRARLCPRVAYPGVGVRVCPNAGSIQWRAFLYDKARDHGVVDRCSKSSRRAF